MIDNDMQLEHSIKAIARMYSIRDRDAESDLYDIETREDIVESTVSMIRKLEREVAVYLAQKYGYSTISEKVSGPVPQNEQAA